MSGVVWAAIAGILFGIFQVVNRQTLVRLDVVASTFIQLLVSSAVMLVALFVQGTDAVGDLSALSITNFTLAGLIHFLGGWTLLNISQKRLGAARTSPLLAATPLFGTVLAIAVFGEVPGAIELAGVALIVGGVYVTQIERGRLAGVPAVGAGTPAGPALTPDASIRASLFGLGAALSWAVSPIFIREGLEDVDDPVLGVTIGVVAATIAFGLMLLVRGRGASLATASRGALVGKIGAGVLVGAGTWARWYALSLTSIAIVLGLGLLTVPTVMLLAPMISGRHAEPITRSVVLGSALVVGGALVLIVKG